MAKGFSLHVGLNRVDPGAYHGWNGALAGCVNDANAMRDICQGQGFETRQLLDGQATAAALLAAIGDIAQRAGPGDTVVISYSGHGGQVPDTTGTEPDGLCETWVCFDRMLVDKELLAQWPGFPAGAHVQVYSDSCHSGTVVRELRLEDFPGFDAAGVRSVQQDGLGHFIGALAPAGARGMPVPAGLAAVAAVLSPAARAAPAAALATPPAGREAARQMAPRFIPPALALALFRENRAFYSRSFRPAPIQCGVTLISGCQDNQLSADGTTNGLFTEKLLQVWDGGAFNGTLPQFHAAITRLMPPDQTPNYDLVGVDDDAMANSRPLTIIGAGTAPAVAPQITGPDSYERANDTPPGFTVTVGAGRNYVVEVASDPALFGDPDRARNQAFYGSWQDSPRLTGSQYRLPQAVWDRLRGGDRLHYRVGSTTSPAPGWDDYLVSTPDENAAAAPGIEITAAAAHPSSLPRISAPATFDRGTATGPVFSVSAGPYFAVEVATSPALFADVAGRTPANFFASWTGTETPSRLQGTSFTLPPGPWDRLRSAAALHYRVLATSSLTAWDDFRMSVENDAAASAPAVRLVGAKAAHAKDASEFDDGGQLDSYLQDQRAADTAVLSSAEEAHAIVAAFRDSAATSPWGSLDRAAVADRLDELIGYPRGLRQGGMNLCGPAAFFMMALARDPAGVARCATELFDTGRGTLGALVVQPGPDIVGADFAALSQRGDVSSQLEWMLLGALRNATEVFWQPSWTGDPRQELAGMSRPEELADWMRQSGLWARVTDGGKWASTPGIPNALDLMVGTGQDHAILINTTMIARGNPLAGVKPDDGFLTSRFPNHWVVLLAEPVMDVARTKVTLHIWTWGGNLSLDVPANDFARNYYGAVTGLFEGGGDGGKAVPRAAGPGKPAARPRPVAAAAPPAGSRRGRTALATTPPEAGA